MKKEDFIKEVVVELETIKQKATKAEIEKLDLSTFDHTHEQHCIYGQMTGDCNNERARELYSKIYEDISREICKDFTPFKQQYMGIGNEFTALEKYLFMSKPPTHKKIIKFLKDEIKTITLK